MAFSQSKFCKDNINTSHCFTLPPLHTKHTTGNQYKDKPICLDRSVNTVHFLIGLRRVGGARFVEKAFDCYGDTGHTCNYEQQNQSNILIPVSFIDIHRVKNCILAISGWHGNTITQLVLCDEMK